ncbi:hypothetical protein Vafri_3953 [Volvox africanus]|uniref:Uncharacterized protein n=1 Tax=Volvox africanus TaxID=51714 RepID=A0A8J4AU54_9CHLO|nr:hypothetical protein Vafri_3953 [Volvox africanus]
MTSTEDANTPQYLSASAEPPLPLLPGEAGFTGARVPTSIQNHGGGISSSSSSTAGCRCDANNEEATRGKALSTHPANDGQPLQQRNAHPSPMSPPSPAAPVTTEVTATATAGSLQADCGTQADGSPHQSHTAYSGRSWSPKPYRRRSYTVLYVRDYGPEDHGLLGQETAPGQTDNYGHCCDHVNDLAAVGSGCTVCRNCLKRQSEPELKQAAPLSLAGSDHMAAGTGRGPLCEAYGHSRGDTSTAPGDGTDAAQHPLSRCGGGGGGAGSSTTGSTGSSSSRRSDDGRGNSSLHLVHVCSSGFAAYPAPAGNGLHAGNSRTGLVGVLVGNSTDIRAPADGGTAADAVLAAALPNIAAAAACIVGKGSNEAHAAKRTPLAPKPATQIEVQSPLINGMGVDAAASDLTGIKLSKQIKSSPETPSLGAVGRDPLAAVSRAAWAASATSAAKQGAESPAAPPSPAAQPMRWRRRSQEGQAHAKVCQQGLSIEQSPLRPPPYAQQHEAKPYSSPPSGNVRSPKLLPRTEPDTHRANGDGTGRNCSWPLNRCGGAADGFGAAPPGSQANRTVQVLDGTQCKASPKKRCGGGVRGGSKGGATGRTMPVTVKEVSSTLKRSAALAPAGLHEAWGHQGKSRGQCTTERDASERRRYHPSASDVASPTPHKVRHPRSSSSRPPDRARAAMSQGRAGADTVVSAVVSQNRGSRGCSRPAAPHNVHLGSGTTRAPLRTSSPAIGRSCSSAGLGKGVTPTCRPLSKDGRDSSDTSSNDTRNPSRHLSLGAGPDGRRRQRPCQVHAVPAGEHVGREAAAAAAVATVVTSAAAAAATGATVNCSTDSDPWFWLSKTRLADSLSGTRGAGVWSSSSSSSSSSSPSSTLAAAASATARQGSVGRGLVTAYGGAAAVGGDPVGPNQVGQAAAAAVAATDASPTSKSAAGRGRSRAAVLCMSPLRHQHGRPAPTSPPTRLHSYRRSDGDEEEEIEGGASSGGSVGGCHRHTAGHEAARRPPVAEQLNVVGGSGEAVPDHRRCGRSTCRREHSERRHTMPRQQESRDRHRHHHHSRIHHHPGLSNHHRRCHSASRSLGKCPDGVGVTAASSGGSGGDGNPDGMLPTCNSPLGVAHVAAEVEAAALAAAVAEDPIDIASADAGANKGPSDVSSQSAAQVATLPRPLVPQLPRPQLQGTGANASTECVRATLESAMLSIGGGAADAVPRSTSDAARPSAPSAAMAAPGPAPSLPSVAPATASLSTSSVVTTAPVGTAVSEMPVIGACTSGSTITSSPEPLLPQSAAQAVVSRMVALGGERSAATEAEAKAVFISGAVNAAAAAAPGVMEIVNGAAAVPGRYPQKDSEIEERAAVPLPVSLSFPATWLEAFNDKVMDGKACQITQLTASDGAGKALRQHSVSEDHPLADGGPVTEAAELEPSTADARRNQQVDAATQPSRLCPPAACGPPPLGRLTLQQPLPGFSASGDVSDVGISMASGLQCLRSSAAAESPEGILQRISAGGGATTTITTTKATTTTSRSWSDVKPVVPVRLSAPAATAAAASYGPPPPAGPARHEGLVPHPAAAAQGASMMHNTPSQPIQVRAPHGQNVPSLQVIVTGPTTFVAAARPPATVATFMEDEVAAHHSSSLLQLLTTSHQYVQQLPHMQPAHGPPVVFDLEQLLSRSATAAPTNRRDDAVVHPETTLRDRGALTSSSPQKDLSWGEHPASAAGYTRGDNSSRGLSSRRGSATGSGGSDNGSGTGCAPLEIAVPFTAAQSGVSCGGDSAAHAAIGTKPSPLLTGQPAAQQQFHHHRSLHSQVPQHQHQHQHLQYHQQQQQRQQQQRHHQHHQQQRQQHHQQQQQLQQYQQQQQQLQQHQQHQQQQQRYDVPSAQQHNRPPHDQQHRQEGQHPRPRCWPATNSNLGMGAPSWQLQGLNHAADASDVPCAPDLSTTYRPAHFGHGRAAHDYSNSSGSSGSGEKDAGRDGKYDHLTLVDNVPAGNGSRTLMRPVISQPHQGPVAGGTAARGMPGHAAPGGSAVPPPPLVLPIAMTTGGGTVHALPLAGGTGVEVTVKLMGLSAVEQAEPSPSPSYGEAGPGHQLDEQHFPTQRKLVNGSLAPGAEQPPSQATGSTVVAPLPLLVNVRLPAGRPAPSAQQYSQQPGRQAYFESVDVGAGGQAGIASLAGATATARHSGLPWLEGALPPDRIDKRHQGYVPDGPGAGAGAVRVDLSHGRFLQSMRARGIQS